MTEGKGARFERYRRGLRYYEKNLRSKLYILYQACLRDEEDEYSYRFTDEELRELVDVAFPDRKEGSGPPGEAAPTGAPNGPPTIGERRSEHGERVCTRSGQRSCRVFRDDE